MNLLLREKTTPKSLTKLTINYIKYIPYENQSNKNIYHYNYYKCLPNKLL